MARLWETAEVNNSHMRGVRPEFGGSEAERGSKTNPDYWKLELRWRSSKELGTYLSAGTLIGPKVSRSSRKPPVRQREKSREIEEEREEDGRSSSRRRAAAIAMATAPTRSLGYGEIPGDGETTNAQTNDKWRENKRQPKQEARKEKKARTTLIPYCSALYPTTIIRCSTLINP